MHEWLVEILCAELLGVVNFDVVAD